MCSIIGSYSAEKVLELAALNAYRGQHSFSMSRFSRDGVLQSMIKGLGELPLDHIRDIEANGDYIICHQQAPTTNNKSIDSVHPAIIDDRHMLWHNGIVKDHWIKANGNGETWDTKIILQRLINGEPLDSIDGTFSCVWYDGEKIRVFRNEISPMFIDDQINISSTKFEGSMSLPPNQVFQLDLINSKFEPLGASFTTYENPYFFME